MAEENDNIKKNGAYYLDLYEKGDFSMTTFKEMLEELSSKSKDEIEAFDASELMTKLNENPRFKNYTRRQEIARGIEGGIEALSTLSGLSVGYRQREKGRELEEGLAKPSAPPVSAKSTELASATESARRDISAPIRDIDPILQQNIQNLRGNLGQAKTASTGQAGIYGSLAQSSFNQATRANNALIPAIQNIRRQQKSEYNKLISAGISEDDMRFKQAMSKYDIANQNYIQEAQAIGSLQATGEQNIYNQQQKLYNQIGGAVNPIMNTNLFNNQQAMQAPQVQPASTQTQGYSAIGNLGQKQQDYKDIIDANLGEWYDGIPTFNRNIKY